MSISDRTGSRVNHRDSLDPEHFCNAGYHLLSATERRGTPVLLSASVYRKIVQSTQRFHVGCDNRCLLGNEYCRLHGCEF